ncbi:helix-turn-helix domain-containing protein [Micromonospora inaquosa]|uniref:HTH cro/C1-type domain-containing protein n=1 Tax=Micromonospora inaquosa TaxID=2203716 RepID=A0A3N9WP67_9ACTN|nr:helix-turn-helix transcriptional regulator [Micromonospora inaquosa]RQX02765.1 hypothetical protein DLJ59_14330 [Micromonospora inaquosa]
MTERANKELSLYDERASTVTGTLGLAAATAAAMVARLFNAGKNASGLTSREVASKLGITEGRVSQVLKGDGNVHIATAARFLRAMGYEISISAVPVEPDRGPLNLTGRRSRRRTVLETEKSFEVYMQKFLTHEGPMEVPMIVPADDTLHTVPFGGPSQVAKVRVSASGRTRRLLPKGEAWQADDVEVHHVGT